MVNSFDKIFMGAAGTSTGGSSDDEFNRVSFLSHFDGANNGVNNAFDDGSTSNHTITVAGNVTQGSFGPFARPDGEWGVDFDGTGDRLKIDTVTNVGSTDFTVEAFINARSLAQYENIVWLQTATHSNNSNNVFTIRASTDNKLEFVTYDSSTAYSTITDAVALNTWHHVTLSKSGTTMYIGLNGTVISRSTASSLNNGDFLNIGAADANGSTDYPWDGHISNVRYILGTALYTSDYTVPTSKLTAVTNTKVLTCQSNRFVDNSSNGYAVTPSGDAAVSAFGPFLTSAVYDPAVNGASARFSADGDDLISATVNDSMGTGDFCLEGWAWSEPNTHGISIIIDTRGGSGGTARPVLAIHNQGKNLVAELPGGNLTSANSLNQYEWNHVAAVRNSETVTLYVNGVAYGTTVQSSTDFGTVPNYRVGVDDDGGPAVYHRGYLSDTRVVLGSPVYTSNFTPPTAPLTAITGTKLLLNMADGQAIDSAAQNNLTLYGNAKLSTGQAKFGDTSLLLDGTGDYAEFPDTNVGNFGTGNFTIECWFRSDQFDSLRTLASKYTTVNGYRSWRLVFQSSSKLQLDITADGGGGNIQNLETAATFNANTWYHLAVVRNGATISIYINGTADSNTLNYGTATVFTSPTSILIGSQSNSSGPRYYFDGYIDDFRISHMARYTSNFTVPSAAFADKGQ